MDGNNTELLTNMIKEMMSMLTGRLDDLEEKFDKLNDSILFRMAGVERNIGSLKEPFSLRGIKEVGKTIDQYIYENCEEHGTQSCGGSVLCPHRTTDFIPNIYLITLEPSATPEEKSQGPWVLKCNGTSNAVLHLKSNERYYFKYLPKCVKVNGEYVTRNNNPDFLDKSLIFFDHIGVRPRPGQFNDLEPINLFDFKWIKLQAGDHSEILYLSFDKSSGTRITLMVE